MASKQNIIRLSAFEGNSFGNGAEKRTSQIIELLSNNKLNVLRLPKTGKAYGNFKSFLKNFDQKFYWIIKSVNYLQSGFNLKTLYKTFLFNLRFNGFQPEFLQQFPKVILWEVTRMELAFAVLMLKKKGYKIIGIPHNIESLVPDNFSAITGKKSPHWLYEEMKMLKLCDEVFTISKEETLLCKQFGIKAIYLPYYPDSICLDFLLKIRNQRNQNIKKINSVLMLGSAINSPTRIGMQDRIDFFTQHRLNDISIKIAGYGTNNLNLQQNCSHIELIGEVSNNQLSQLLIETDVLLIHQRATSGALTRIIESLIAGIPIILNFESSRDYFGTDGIYYYESNNELLNILNSPIETLPKMPKKSEKQEQKFCEIINEYLLNENYTKDT